MEIFRESLAEENGPREAFTWLPLFWSGQRRGGGLRRVVSDLGRPPVGREGLSPFLSHLSPRFPHFFSEEVTKQERANETHKMTEEMGFYPRD